MKNVKIFNLKVTGPNYYLAFASKKNLLKILLEKLRNES